jgi:hypothetical protein
MQQVSELASFIFVSSTHKSKWGKALPKCGEICDAHLQENT